MIEKIEGVYPSVQIEGFSSYPEITKVTIGDEDSGLTTIVVTPYIVRYDQYDSGTARLQVEINGHKYHQVNGRD